ncbi:MAG: hypothetical protein ACRCWQ_00755 [Bacilli bacterium]
MGKKQKNNQANKTAALNTEFASETNVTNEVKSEAVKQNKKQKKNK